MLHETQALNYSGLDLAGRPAERAPPVSARPE